MIIIDIHTLTGRVLTGVGLGMIMPASRVYTSEISLPNMRGTIGTFLNLAMALGITFQVREIITILRRKELDCSITVTIANKAN